MKFDDEETIVDYVPTYVPDKPVVAESFDESGIQIGALTHPGRTRTTNEDQYAVMRRTRKGVVLASSLADKDLPTTEEHAWLFAVADGLGGHAAGEVASATAIRTVLTFANGLSSWIMRPTDGLRDDIAQRVDLYIQAIQTQLQEQAKLKSGLAGMATTLTAAYLYGSNGVVVNVGDSRSYLLRSGELYQITQDHTVAQDMQNRGKAPETTRPYRSVLTRCLTTSAKPVNVDLYHVDLIPGDQLLLCTDGLTDMISDRVILETVREASAVKDACEQLVTAALAHGGRDNVTVVLARV